MQINETMKYAVSREQFLELMESEGYTVLWTANRKSITYTCLLYTSDAADE